MLVSNVGLLGSLPTQVTKSRRSLSVSRVQYFRPLKRLVRREAETGGKARVWQGKGGNWEGRELGRAGKGRAVDHT